MELDPVAIRPLDAAGEDALVAYRLQHPENAARLLSSAWNVAHSSLAAPELTELRASKQAQYQESSDIEALRYVGSIKRLVKAKEVQEQQVALFQQQRDAIVAQREAELIALDQEKKALEAERRKKESFKKCDLLAKEIAGKKQGRVQLDSLIRQVTEQLEQEQQRKQSFLAEASERKQQFASIGNSLASILALEKTEPARSSADLPKLQTLAKPPSSRPIAPALSRTATLDPKAAAFTPSTSAAGSTRPLPGPVAKLGRTASLREQVKSQDATPSGSRAASRNGSRAATPAPSKESGEISFSSAATDVAKSSPIAADFASTKATAEGQDRGEAGSSQATDPQIAASPKPSAQAAAGATVDDSGGGKASRNSSVAPREGSPAGHKAVTDEEASELSSVPGTREGTIDPAGQEQADGPPPKVTGKRVRGARANADTASNKTDRQTRSSSRGRKPAGSAPSALPRLRSQSRGKRGKESQASSPAKQESIAEEDEQGEVERPGRSSKRRRKGGK